MANAKRGLSKKAKTQLQDLVNKLENLEANELSNIDIPQSKDAEYQAYEMVCGHISSAVYVAKRLLTERSEAQ